MRPGPAPLGQHALADEAVADRVVAAAALRPGETALDVGAGEGALALRAARAVGPSGRVTAVELDPGLAARLRAAAPPQLRVVVGDALELPLPACDAVLANPPFRIAAPLLRRLLDAGFGRAVLVLPAELAARLAARPGTEAYGRLTIEVALRARSEPLFRVPARAFRPPPRVPCAVVRLEPLPPHGLDPAVLEALLARAWASKRRTLRHALAPLAADLRVSSGAITAALRARGWEGATPGKLAPPDYAALARALADARRL